MRDELQILTWLQVTRKNKCWVARCYVDKKTGVWLIESAWGNGNLWKVRNSSEMINVFLYLRNVLVDLQSMYIDGSKKKSKTIFLPNGDEPHGSSSKTLTNKTHQKPNIWIPLGFVEHHAIRICAFHFWLHHTHGSSISSDKTESKYNLEETHPEVSSYLQNLRNYWKNLF